MNRHIQAAGDGAVAGNYRRQRPRDVTTTMCRRTVNVLRGKDKWVSVMAAAPVLNQRPLN